MGGLGRCSVAWGCPCVAGLVLHSVRVCAVGAGAVPVPQPCAEAVGMSSCRFEGSVLHREEAEVA